MDFIERLLGISPDGGSGLAEAAVLGGIVLGVLGAFIVVRGGVRRWSRRRDRHE